MSWQEEFVVNDPWRNDRNLGSWSFTPTTADNRYNEGNKITDSTNPVWSMDDPTGVPITRTHYPCGYWTLGTLRSEPVYYSSRPYPIVDVEELDSSGVHITAGVLFTQQYVEYEIPFEGVDSSGVVISAGRLGVIQAYEIPFEGVDSSGVVISAGRLKVTQAYEIPFEGVDSSGVTISAGEQKDAILYTNWEIEGVDSSGVTISTGALVTP